MKHILMVDDVTTNLKLAAEVLQNHYKLSMAKSGAQAIAFLQKVKPDLILLDIKMPEMDGYQTLEIIKSNPDTANIPVVFLTVDNQRESEIKGLKMGAMDFILKPFEPEVMLSRIDKILQIEDLRKDLSISAKKDVLTNLWNRKYLEEEVNHYFDQDNDHLKGVFILIDIDHFKEINDNFGHIMGDAVLVKLAQIIEERLGPKDLGGRMGGDEFAIFLRGEYAADEIKNYCRIIMSSVEKEISLTNQDGSHINISMGIAVAPDDGNEFMTLYNHADKALYYVKQNGRNNFHFYREKEEHVFDGEGKRAGIADMNRLEKVIEENEYISGAYRVEYEGFRHIYHFISRSIGRTGQMAQMILLTLKEQNHSAITPTQMEDSMKQLESAIVVSLRRGDVATHYSSFQYLVLLIDTTQANAVNVSERIMKIWKELNDNPNLSIEYECKEVQPGTSAEDK